MKIAKDVVIFILLLPVIVLLLPWVAYELYTFWRDREVLNDFFGFDID